VEACPLESVLDLIPVSSRVENLFYFPLLLFSDGNRRRWRLVVSWDGFGTGCGF